MAYDLQVGPDRSSRAGRNARRHHVASVDFDELPAACRLMKRTDSTFLHHVSNLFEDQAFSVDEVRRALEELLPLLEQDLHPDERLFLHKIVAALAYAQWKQLWLFGMAD